MDFFAQMTSPPMELVLPIVAGLGVCGLLFTIAKICNWPGDKSPECADGEPLAALVTQKPQHERKWSRREGNPVEVQISLSTKKSKVRSGYVIDRSPGGLGIFTHEPYVEGAALAVKPILADDLAPWIDVEVRACNPTSDGFEIGCKFIRTPPWSVLMLFG